MGIPQSTSLPVPTGAVGQPLSWQRRVVTIILGVVSLFAIAYTLAWYNSFRLGSEFYQDAEKSYSEGRYLDALAGYEDVNLQANTRTERGGYYQVTKLWGSGYAIPKPGIYALAQQRIQTIIQSKLDINSAEAFIQENTGRNHPLFADIYYQLGQLYEASGDKPSAIEIYRDCSKLFPNRPDITKAAIEKLKSLGVDN